MKSGFDKRLLAVWLSLAAITLVQFAVDSLPGHGIQSPGGWITIGVVAIALLKVRLILHEFMELRHAPRRLARLADLWVGATGVILLAVHFLGLAWSPN